MPSQLQNLYDELECFKTLHFISLKHVIWPDKGVDLESKRLKNCDPLIKGVVQFPNQPSESTSKWLQKAITLTIFMNDLVKPV